jgi:hypothetical protein
MAYHPAKKEAEKVKIPGGILSERFPKAESIVIRMEYFQKEVANAVLMLRTVNFYPNSEADFLMRCMNKECLEGGFNLYPTITSMVRRRKPGAKGTMPCSGKTAGVPPDHASISYEIYITYKKIPKPKAKPKAKVKPKAKAKPKPKPKPKKKPRKS